MKKVTTEIKKILELIYNASFSPNDLAMLFIYMRNFKNNDSVVRELGDFIAHSEGRDVGTSHGKIKDYIMNMIEVSAGKKNILSGKKMICNKQSIIQCLMKILKEKITDFDQEKFLKQEDQIIKFLFEKLDNIEFIFEDHKLNNIRVNKCFLKNDFSKLSFCFNISLNSGRIIIGKDALWCNTLIG